jgi:hypothetical protein
LCDLKTGESVLKTGVVYKVFTKEFPGKGGKKGNTWYSIKLEGDDTYYRCKSSNPGAIEGKTVSFEVDGDQVTSKPTIIESEAPKKAGYMSETSAAGSAYAGPPLGSARESSIHYQSARKDALQFLDIVTRTGAVKLPAKEAAKLEALEALADSYTAKFFSDISTFGAVARANGAEEEPATTGAAAEEDDE